MVVIVEEVLPTGRLNEQTNEDAIRTVTRLCFTHVPVTNVHLSAAWYEEMLGFKADLVVDTHAILQPDLHLLRTDGPVFQNIVDGRPLPRTAYFTDYIQEHYDYLLSRGVQLEPIVEEGECGWHFDLSDPDGNVITIWRAKN